MSEFGVYKKGDFRFFIPTATYEQLDTEAEKLPFDEQIDRVRKAFDPNTVYEIEKIAFEADEELGLGTNLSLRIAVTDWILGIFLYRIHKSHDDALNQAIYDRTTEDGFQYFMEAVQWATIAAWNIMLEQKKVRDRELWPGDSYTPIYADDLLEMNKRDAEYENIKFKPMPVWYCQPLDWLADELWKKVSVVNNPEIARRWPVEYECWSPKCLTYAFEAGINTDAADDILSRTILEFIVDRNTVLNLPDRNRKVLTGDLVSLSWVYDTLRDIYQGDIPRIDD